MIRHHLRNFVAYLCLGLALAAQPAGRESPEILLERAIQKQTVDGDLRAAIEIYKKILERTGRNRTVEAKALLRLGQCQEKLGQTEAVKAYERLARDYADQATEASAARARLAALKAPNSGGLSLRRFFEGFTDRYGNAVSYNGRYLMTNQEVQGNWLLQLHDIGTGEARKVPCSYFVCAHISLSPDGAEFAYRPIYPTGANLVSEVRIARTDGSNDRVLYQPPDEVEYVMPYGFTPDGRQYLIGRRHKDGRHDFIVVTLKDGLTRRFLTGGHTLSRRGVVFSPDSRFIAFDVLPEGNRTNQDIHILSLDSGGITVLADGPADEGVLGWAPDSSGLVVRSDKSGRPDAYFQPMRGALVNGPPRLVVRDVGRLAGVNLGFTMDGRFFYRKQRESGGAFISRLDESGRFDPKLQEVGGGQALVIAWSPDGAKQAFAFQPESGSEYAIGIQVFPSGDVSTLPSPIPPAAMEWLRDNSTLVIVGHDRAIFRTVIGLLDTRTGKWTVLKTIEDPDIRATNLAVPGDGKYLYYQESRPGEPFRSIRRDLANGQESLVFERVGGGGPSPDGRSFGILDSGVLKVVSLDDGSSRVIAKDAEGTFEWSADGESILFRRNSRELWRAPAAGGAPVQVGVFEHPFRSLKIHPSGRYISIEITGRTVEVWVAENLLSAAKAGAR